MRTNPDTLNGLGGARPRRHFQVLDPTIGPDLGPIAARIGEQVLWQLDAPVGRVCTEEVPIPYPKHLEDAAIPQPDRIVAAARHLLGKD